MCAGPASCSRLEKAGELQGLQERERTQGIPAGRPQLAHLQLVQLVSGLQELHIYYECSIPQMRNIFHVFPRRNCILADEMGLGKTIQSITFLYEMFMKNIEGPFLVIAPLSTIPNWEREFRTWTQLNVVVYHGSQASRKTIQAYEMYYRDAQVRRIEVTMES